MSNPALKFGELQKRQKADRLREESRDRGAAARALGALYRAVYKRDEYRCVACGRRVDPGSKDELLKAHPHHIIKRSSTRLAKAEKHTMANLCTLCPFCHADVHCSPPRLSITGRAPRLKIRRLR